MTHRPFTRRLFHRAAFSRPRFHRAAFSRLAAAATISGLGDGMTQVAGALLAFLSANLAVFSSVGATLRQSLAPPGMLGRVQGAYRAVSSTGLLAGAALGSLLTSVAGLTAPLWLGLAAITMVIALAWRPFGALGTAGVSATAP